MITITVDNSMARIVGFLPKEVLDHLDEETSFDVAGAQFSSLVQEGKWDGCKHLLSRKTQRFPSGLLDRVIKILNEHNIPVTLQDLRVEPSLKQTLSSDVVLHDWQKAVIDKCLSSKRGVVKLPTGSGKTYVMMYLLSQLQQKTIILVDKIDILLQTAKRIKKHMGLSVGIIGGGEVTDGPIVIGMFQTLARANNIKVVKMEEKDNTKLDISKKALIQKIISESICVVHDECQHAGASTYSNVLKTFHNSYYKFGLSATPYKKSASNLLLEAAFGPTIVDISCSELIAKGYLSKPTFYFIKLKHKPVPKEWDYADVYSNQIVLNSERNLLAVKLGCKFWKAGKSVLLIVNHIQHGEILQNMFSQVIGKENVRFIQGSTDKDFRSQTLEDLDTGEARLVIATKVYSEGISINNLNVLINLKCQISSVDYIQIVGRALRLTETKKRVDIIDFYDFGCKYLKNHSDVRLELVSQEPLFDIRMIDAHNV